MKKTFLAFTSIILLAITFSGCSTSQVTTAYKTETAIDTSVTTAWSLWQAYVTASATSNPVSAATQTSVIAAFNKVKAAELILIDASALAASSSTNSTLMGNLTADSTALTSAVTDLSNLLATFNIKL